MPTRLTFDKLFRMSDPKRYSRSHDVKGPPLDIDAFKDTVYYAFNFKSNVTNTTGLRHRGYVKFFKPRSNQPVPLERLQCVVDCECPDYKYRWAWANKQRGSGAVGPNSLNQAWNKAPRKTNPKSVPGLCKHILHMSEFIYGLLSSFPSDRPDTSDKFEKLLTHAKKRWSDFQGAMDQARARERMMAQRQRLRNTAGPLEEPEAEPAVPEPPAEDVAAARELAVPPGQRGRGFPGAKPPELPGETELPEPPADDLAAASRLAVPPGQRGRTMPGGKTSTISPTAPKPEEPVKGKVETGGFPTVAQRRAARYGESLSDVCVVSPSGETVMNTIVQPLDSKIVKIVEDMLDDEAGLNAGAGGPPPGDFGGEPDAVGAPDLPPSEPPMTDSAIGADTEGDTALSLLTQMNDGIQRLAQALAPPEEDPNANPDGAGGPPPGAGGGMPAGIEGAEGGPGAEGEGGGEELGVPEPEAAEEGGEEGGEGGGEREGGEAEEGGEEGGEEEEKPKKPSNKRPVGD